MSKVLFDFYTYEHSYVVCALKKMCLFQEAVSLVEAVDASSPTKDLLPDLQNSVKNQLLLQALPPYVPPDAPNQQYSSDQFFSCRDCGDK
jgi:hypothetical protein